MTTAAVLLLLAVGAYWTWVQTAGWRNTRAFQCSGREVAKAPGVHPAGKQRVFDQDTDLTHLAGLDRELDRMARKARGEYEELRKQNEAADGWGA